MIEAHLKPITDKIRDTISEEEVNNVATYNDVYKSPLVAPEDFSFGESFGAGFRQYAPAQAIMRMIENSDFVDDPSYDPIKDTQIPKGYEWRFINSASEQETTIRLKRLKDDLRDLEIIENGNLLAVGLGGLVSPLTLAPIGTFKTLSQSSFLRRFIGSATFTAALYAPEELLIATQNMGRSEISQTLIPLAGAYLIGGTIGGSSVGAVSGSGGEISESTGAFTSGAGSDNLFNFGTAGATSGIGILKATGSAVLKIELDALESQGLGKTVSNPKLFTLDNQTASIKQGEQIPVSGGDGADTFADAALKLTVTPNIIGDGNVMLTIVVNNDTPNRSTPGTPGINTMEINTKLLVADGDIVVIGGIKKNNVASAKRGVPGAGNVPVVGNLFKGSSQSDTMNELLVFIAPRIL